MKSCFYFIFFFIQSIFEILLLWWIAPWKLIRFPVFWSKLLCRVGYDEICSAHTCIWTTNVDRTVLTPAVLCTPSSGHKPLTTAVPCTPLLGTQATDFLREVKLIPSTPEVPSGMERMTKQTNVTNLNSGFACSRICLSFLCGFSHPTSTP